jgi:hypothetical protein
MHIFYGDLVPTSQRKQWASIRNTYWWMLCGEIKLISCKTHIGHTNTHKHTHRHTLTQTHTHTHTPKTTHTPHTRTHTHHPHTQTHKNTHTHTTPTHITPSHTTPTQTQTHTHTLYGSALGQALLILEVSRSHTDPPHLVGPLEDCSACHRHFYLTTLTTKTNSHAQGGSRTPNTSKRAAADPTL